MPQQLAVSVENNFTKGLITESTGLNFPENAATDASNCQFTLIGDVLRRKGINREANFGNIVAGRTNKAMSSFVWNNPGGDSSARVLVKQIGSILFFYNIAASTVASPLSNHYMTQIDMSSYSPSTFDVTTECTYSSGNGFLFVYNPSCSPLYCTYTAGAINVVKISLKTRDFQGVLDSLGTTDRPTSLSGDHNYNLQNQGWVTAPVWSAFSTDIKTVPSGGGPMGFQTFTVAAAIAGVTLGQSVTLTGFFWTGAVVNTIYNCYCVGTVTAYVGTSMTVNITATSGSILPASYTNWTIKPASSSGYTATWNAAAGNYPSNADVWWYFKNSAGLFDPATTISNISLASGNAPRGHFILDPFTQDRSLLSGVAGITVVSTNKRPSTGTWFQGRVWYTGVDDSQAASSDTAFYSWSENIYFSQVVNTAADFGNCYQVNDPTSQNLFDLLPTDGGIISIPATGKIFKLFPVANGMLVFAANGVWFITGSQGIGFTANDYTVTKISAVRSVSSTSFVDVQGLPYFWNEEGIYQVQPQQNGSLAVEPITVGTILTFFNEIPFASKMYVRGDYDPIEYVIQWTYRSTQETDVTSRYNFDTILNYNVYNKAFYPYTIGTNIGGDFIHGINYITYPTITATTPEPGFKYPSSFPSGGSYDHQFAEEYDTNYVDWAAGGVGINYVSYFITGYKLRGMAIKKFQPQYVQVYFRTEDFPTTAYSIQGLWDFSNSGDSGRWTTKETVLTGSSNYNTRYRRHKIRGRGYALQIKMSSQDGLPFDIQGWAIVDTVNSGT